MQHSYLEDVVALENAEEKKLALEKNHKHIILPVIVIPHAVVLPKQTIPLRMNHLAGEETLAEIMRSKCFGLVYGGCFQGRNFEDLEIVGTVVVATSLSFNETH